MYNDIEFQEVRSRVINKYLPLIPIIKLIFSKTKLTMIKHEACHFSFYVKHQGAIITLANKGGALFVE